MFWIIVTREVRDGFKSYTYLSALALLTLIIPLSAYRQGQYYQEMVADYEARQTIHNVENSPNAITVAKPVPPMLPFFNGVYDRLPGEMTLRIDSVLRETPGEDLKPLDWLFPKTDLSVILGVLMTLMAILLVHDAVVGEREQGTLMLILSGPVPRYTVLIAKIIGVVVLMVSSLIYSVALYVTIVAGFSGGAFSFTPERCLEITIFTGLAFLTILLFIALGFVVSTMTKSSTNSLAVYVSAWVVLVMVWPSLASYLSLSLKPVQARQATQRDLLNKEVELIREELAEHKKQAESLAMQGADVESAWQKYLQLRREWIEKKRAEIGQMAEEQKRRAGDSHALSSVLLAASPYGAFNGALSHLCATGLRDHELFTGAVERYYSEQFVPESLKTLSQEKPWLQASGKSDSFEMPPFEMPPRSLAKRLGEMLLPVGLQVFEAGMLFIISFVKFRRYDCNPSH